jgi:DNA modification methylase
MSNWRNRIVGNEDVDPKTINLNPSNYRDHPEYQRAVMSGILDEIGWIQTVVVNKNTNNIIDGHLRVEIAIENGDETVPVTYVDLDEEEERKALITFNPVAQLARENKKKLEKTLQNLDIKNENMVKLAELVAHKNKLEYVPPSRAGLLDETDDTDDNDEDDDDSEEKENSESDALLEKWKVEEGQVWQLGRHKIICGDSTDKATVIRLMGGTKAVCMWTDPPYGVSYVGKTKDALVIDNDGSADIRALLTDAFAVTNTILKEGSPIYVSHPPGVLSLTFGDCFVSAGWHFHETLVWVKDSMVLGHSDYHYKHEPIIYGWKGKNHNWYAGRDQVSVFEVDRPKRSKLHPTSKPIDLIEAHLNNSTKKNDIVYDPFGGSGSTLLACEKMGRRAMLVELSPKYVAVCLEKYYLASNEKPFLATD